MSVESSALEAPGRQTGGRVLRVLEDGPEPTVSGLSVVSSRRRPVMDLNDILDLEWRPLPVDPEGLA
jgi:hypothetical protein